MAHKVHVEFTADDLKLKDCAALVTELLNGDFTVMRITFDGSAEARVISRLKHAAKNWKGIEVLQARAFRREPTVFFSHVHDY
jgi:hypothetical protein